MTSALTAEPPVTSSDAPKRAVIYARLSVAKDGDTAGVDRQEAACRALAASRGWEVAAVVTENDMSATSGKRPGYHRMLEDVKAGTYDIVLGWAVDRLTRSPGEIEDLITLAERTGALVSTVSGDLDLTTDQGRLVARILASVARGEVERKAARQRAANLQSAEAGEQPRKRAFGYCADGTVDPVEGPVVRELFTQYAAGASIGSLARSLNERGITSTRNGPWTIVGVRKMLANPRYVAERWSTVRARNGVESRVFVAAGKWDALVAEETFRAAQARLADNVARTPAKAPNTKHLSSGLLTCGVCGGVMRSWWRSRRPSGGDIVNTVMYKCASGSHVIRKATDIDALVTTEVVARLRMPDVIKALMAQEENAGRGAELTERAVGLQSRLDELPDAIADGVLSPALAGQAERRIRAEMDEIEAKLGKLAERDPLALVAGKADRGAAWRELIGSDLKAAQSIVRRLATSITVAKGKAGRAPFDPTAVRFEWRQPGESVADERV
jgi:site-specific DNA recombinase